MKMIAVITEDFSVYYELVKLLRASKKAFLTLTPGDPIPSSVGVVITTAAEEWRVDFRPRLVIQGTDEPSMKMTVQLAEEALAGKSEYDSLVFGIDPGKRTGVAVLGDGAVIHTAEVWPHDVPDEVRRVLRTHNSRDVRFRVGHGDPPNRNRIINMLLELGYPVEMINERSTSHGLDEPHSRAAAEIAIMSGPRVKRMIETVPTRGELHEAKRLSRLASNGTVTISDGLAESVVKGDISLEEAIQRQTRRGKKRSVQDPDNE
jgi:hypothetical protein